MVTPNDDGTFTIYINDRLSDVEKIKALNHELQHIRNDDFYREEPVVDKESRCRDVSA